MEFRFESATCRLTPHGDGTADLTHLYSGQRGNGHATGVVTLALRYADEHELETYLLARGYGGPTQTMLSNEQLVEFYNKFGFVAIDGPFSTPRMKRPRTKNTPYDEREN